MMDRAAEPSRSSAQQVPRLSERKRMNGLSTLRRALSQLQVKHSIYSPHVLFCVSDISSSILEPSVKEGMNCAYLFAALGQIFSRSRHALLLFCRFSPPITGTVRGFDIARYRQQVESGPTAAPPPPAQTHRVMTLADHISVTQQPRVTHFMHTVHLW